MYSDYSILQKTQLLSEQYINTQDVRLLILESDRHVSLQRSLKKQLHRNFCVVTNMSQVLHEEADGILLLTEDTELMSIALTRFADAIQQGNDFAYCDAVFGPNGETECALPDASNISTMYGGAAVLSKDLFLEIYKNNGVTNSNCLLRSAFKLAQKKVHIPVALTAYRREIQPDDVFKNSKKRALLLCHEFTMTGAPIVLVSAVQVLKSYGFETIVLGPKIEEAAILYQEQGIVVITNPEKLKNSALHGIALCCDFIMANTMVEADAVESLNQAPVPVLWWLHDAFWGYSLMQGHYIESVGKNIRIAAVGKHAIAAMHSIRPQFEIEELLYGLSDFSKEDIKPYDFNTASGETLFVTVGSLEQRKGQDILAEAISLLNKEDLAKSRFLFVGRSISQSILDTVLTLSKAYPNRVEYIEFLTRDQIKSLMQQCDCVVCSSRDDPMPTFVTEGAMFGKPAIVSEHTGTAGLITNGVNGFVYPNDDPAELARLLQYIIANPEILKGMREEVRSLYNRRFSEQTFQRSFGAILKEMTGC